MDYESSHAKFRRANYDLYRLFRCEDANGNVSFILPKSNPLKSYMKIYSTSKEFLEFKYNIESEYYMLIEDIELECGTFSDLLEVRKLTVEDWSAIAQIQFVKKPINLRDQRLSNEVLDAILR